MNLDRKYPLTGPIEIAEVQARLQNVPGESCRSPWSLNSHQHPSHRMTMSLENNYGKGDATDMQTSTSANFITTDPDGDVDMMDCSSGSSFRSTSSAQTHHQGYHNPSSCDATYAFYPACSTGIPPQQRDFGMSMHRNRNDASMSHKFRRRSPCYGRHHHSIPSFHLLMEQRNIMDHHEAYNSNSKGLSDSSVNDICAPSSSFFSPSTSLFQTFYASPPKPRMTMTMEEAIELRRYDILHHNLSPQPRQNNFQDLKQHGHGLGPRCERQHYDPNEEILFHKKSVYMTGLEYAVFQNDWKMAILFYMHAADPSYNCFDGRIIREEHQHLAVNADADTNAAARDDQNQENDDEDEDGDEIHHPGRVVHGHHQRRLRDAGASANANVRTSTGTSDALMHAAFLHHLSKTHDNHVPIAGFKGLYTLLNSIHKFMNLDKDDCDEFEYNREEFNKTMDSLWLMEQCYSERKVVYKHDSRIVGRTRRALIDIGTEHVWRREFCDRVYFLIQIMRRGGRGGDDASKRELVSSACDGSECMIPNEICLYVMEYLVDDLLSHTIWRALKHVSDSAASMNTE